MSNVATPTLPAGAVKPPAGSRSIRAQISRLRPGKALLAHADGVTRSIVERSADGSKIHVYHVETDGSASVQERAWWLR